MITIGPKIAAQDLVALPPAVAEIDVCPFVVIEDNNEQLPWTFQGIVIANRQAIVKRVRQSLHTGDYSIEGYDGFVCIERKSPADLVGSITRGHVRFQAEHERMAGMVQAGGFACLVCEASLSDLDDELRRDGRHAAAETLWGTVASWPMKFRTPWLFAGDRRRAEVLAFRLLRRWWDQNVGQRKASEEPSE
jgi:hypothetical protein